MKSILFFVVMILSIMTFAQDKPDVQCKIVEIDSSLEDYQCYSGLKLECSECTIRYLNHKQIERRKPLLTAVEFTFKSNNDSILNIESNFENIKLISASNKIKHPYAVRFSDSYLRKLTARNFNFIYKQHSKVKILLIFRKADIGDKISIDDFLPATTIE